MELIDLLFIITIVVIIIGGMVALHFLLPKEKNFDDEHAHSYRIMYRDGSYSVTHKKASFGENIISLRSKYFYIPKAPFTVEAFCDEAVGKDGKTYRASAEVSVYFPEEKLQIFAPTFHGVNEEGIQETIAEGASAALEEAVKQYEGDQPFDEFFKKTAEKSMEMFGIIIMSVKSLNVNKIGSETE